MKKLNTLTITSDNLDEVIEQLNTINKRFTAQKIAAWIASITFVLVSLFMLFNLAIANVHDAEVLAELGAIPFLRSFADMSIDYMNHMPEPWYFKLLLWLLFLCVPPIAAYHAVYFILFLPLKLVPWRLALSSKTSLKAKKLYKAACSFCADDRISWIRLATVVIASIIIVIFSIGVLFLAILLEVRSIDILEIFGYLFGSAVIGFCTFFYLLLLLLIDNWITFLILRSKKDEDYEWQAVELKISLHNYWISVDPEEAERVAEEERKRRRNENISWGVGLQIYEQYKSGAHQSLGYSSSPTTSSTGLTYQDHDDLDAVQRAAAERGDDYHTGV